MDSGNSFVHAIWFENDIGEGRSECPLEVCC